MTNRPWSSVRIMAIELPGAVSLPFIPSALPTTPRFSGTDIKLIWWTLQSTTSIGAYQDASQFGEVVWHFTPEAAVRAAESRFHPTQTLEHEDDGSLIVRFHAAGWLEMAWFLYQWGDAVEGLAPQKLRDMTAGYRRSEFEALP